MDQCVEISKDGLSPCVVHSGLSSTAPLEIVLERDCKEMVHFSLELKHFFFVGTSHLLSLLNDHCS